MRILIVEDDPRTLELVRTVLEDACYAVDAAADGMTADALMAVNAYDLAVLDRGIPAPSGLELLRAWRRGGKRLPVLILTGRAEVDDRVEGLDAGADDYLTKPFAVAELLARVRSLLRRREKPLRPTLEVGPLRLDRSRYRATADGRGLQLTPKEFAVLEHLMARQGAVVTRAEIEEHSWDDDAEPMANVVDVTIHRLRKKLEAGARDRLIHTVRGVGYVLRCEGHPGKNGGSP